MSDRNKEFHSAKSTGLGYPHIEDLIETENFEQVNQTFAEAYDKLEKIHADLSQGTKKQKAARKIMQAYELTTQLMNELLLIKRDLMEKQAEGRKK